MLLVFSLLYIYVIGIEIIIIDTSLSSVFYKYVYLLDYSIFTFISTL